MDLLLALAPPVASAPFGSMNSLAPAPMAPASLAPAPAASGPHPLTPSQGQRIITGLLGLAVITGATALVGSAVARRSDVDPGTGAKIAALGYIGGVAGIAAVVLPIAYLSRPAPRTA